MKIKDLVKKAHENAIEKGFYENKRNISELLMLIVSELGEAQEALRKNKRCLNFDPKSNDVNIDSLYSYNFEKYIKDTFEDEIADTFIRLFDLCGYLNINIEKHIIAKMEYNKIRPVKHGKEF